MARIDAILKLVKEQGASDLHLTTGAPPMVRINGEITPIPYEELTREINELLLFEIMDPEIRARATSATRTSTSRTRCPGVVRVRCNIYEQTTGVAGAFRILPNQILTLEQLGLPPHVARLTETARGLVLVTGPPGTGKSSTLAAMIDHINRTQKKHILTIEDPIEYRHANRSSLVTQREVGRNTPSFAQALQGGAARGSRRDPGRRDARPRDHGARDHRRRHRAARVRHAAHDERRSDRGPHPRLVRGRAAGPGAPDARRVAARACSRSACCAGPTAAAACWRSRS